MDMLGKDYAKQTAHNALLIKKNETISEDVAVLAGARLVATSETERGAQLAETLVKQIAGGDKIRARFLHQNSFEFTPSYKIWMATNHKPEIKGTDEGIWRKMRLIPFEVKITEAQKDVFLPDKLKLELPGILAWAVEGCKKWLSEGLESPPEVLRATAQYRAEMDVIAAFVEEKCVIKEGAFIQARKLYNIFSIWAKESGEKEMTEKKFSLDLKGRGYESKKRSGYNVWLGIGERTDEDRERYDLGAEGAGLRDEEIF
jgi:putative DNA primase/helicase